jgi:glycosyltransferase involved in cell wall biosynthesis
VGYNNSKIKVLMLAPQKLVGGITTWARFLLKHIDPECADVKVIETSRMFVKLGQGLGFRGAVLGMRDAVKRFFQILYWLVKFSPDVVHINTSPSIGLLVRDVPLFIVLRIVGFSCVAHLHGGNVEGFYGRKGLKKDILRWGFRCCRAIFVITRECESQGRQLFGDRIIYVPNMIDDELLEDKSEKQICSLQQKSPLQLIHVAWQHPVKGSLDIVRSMRYANSAVRCQLIGAAAPDSEISINSEIDQLGVRNKVFMVGLKTGVELKGIYQHADMLVFPSHFEGFPMVILEAMAYGLPIIASEVGNIREMIGVDTDRPAGVLLKQVDPIDPKELAALIDNLAQDTVKRQAFSRNGVQRVTEEYAASKVVPKIEKIWAQIAHSILSKQKMNTYFEQK